MKIVQVSPYSMDRPGGVQTHIRDLSAWLRGQGYAVRVVSPPGSDGDADSIALGGFRTMSLHGTAFEISRARRSDLRGLVADLHDWGADVVHLHTPWTPMLAWQVWRELKLPAIGTFHATLPDGSGFDPFRWYIRRAARHFHRHLDTVIVPSAAPLRQWQALGVSPEPRISPPAIDLGRWRAAQRPRSGGPHLVFMGRLEERKGVRILLEAWATIAAALPEARLTIAGDGALRGALMRYSQEANLTSVAFVPPPSDAEAPALIASADFFVAPATGGESFGLVLIEAMSAGALPVAAANPGYATVLTGDGADLLVPRQDSAALADKVIALARDPARCARLSDWAQTHAARFDVAAVGHDLLACYEAAIHREKQA